MFFFEQFVHQPVIEGQPGRVHRTSAGGQDARPGSREAVGIQTQLLHHSDIFFVAMIMVYGNVTGLIVGDLAGYVGEGIPDGDAFAVFVPGALELVSGGGAAPDEILREDDFRHCFLEECVEARCVTSVIRD